MIKQLTIKEIARQLVDGLEMNVNDIEVRLESYLQENPMTLDQLNNICWEDSTIIFDAIM